MFAEVIPLDFLVFVLDFGFSMQHLVGSSIKAVDLLLAKQSQEFSESIC